jgi:hypothetical protein
MNSRIIGAAVIAAVLAAVPAVASAEKPAHPSKPAATPAKGKATSGDRRCRKIAVAKGFVVTGTVSDVVSTGTGAAFSGTFTLTVTHANKHARDAGWSSGIQQPVTLADVPVSVQDGADPTLADGQAVKLTGKILVPRKTKKFDCGATAGAPTFKRLVLQAPGSATPAGE